MLGKRGIVLWYQLSIQRDHNDLDVLTSGLPPANLGCTANGTGDWSGASLTPAFMEGQQGLAQGTIFSPGRLHEFLGFMVNVSARF